MFPLKESGVDLPGVVEVHLQDLLKADLITEFLNTEGKVRLY